MTDINQLLSGNPDEKPVVAYSEVYDDKKVYVGPRKDDGDVVETFHYGDGKWVVSFAYSKDSKVAENNTARSKTNCEDKGGEQVDIGVFGAHPSGQ